MYEKLLELKNHHGFLRYFKNTGWLFSEQILRILSGLILGVWVARYLGPNQFGIYSYSLAFASIFIGFSKLGLDAIVTRDLTYFPERKIAYLGTAFWLKILSAIFVISLLALTVSFFNNDLNTKIYIFIISIGLLFQSFEVIEFYFQSTVQAKSISICKATQLIISSLIKIYLIHIEADLIWFVWLIVFDSLTLAISYIVSYYLGSNQYFFGEFDSGVAKNFLKNSWPLILSGLAISIHMKIDQIMIKEMLGAEAVGQYAAAARISESWYFLPSIIVTSVFPAIINAKKKSKTLYYSRLQNLFRFMIWLSVLVALPTSVLSNWIVDILFGDNYQQASGVLTIHIWAGIAVTFGMVWSKWIVVENQQYMVIIFHILAMVLNILLNLLLIPQVGLLGAALATALSSILSQVLGIICFNRKRTLIFIMNSIFPILDEGKTFE